MGVLFVPCGQFLPGFYGELNEIALQVQIFVTVNFPDAYGVCKWTVTWHLQGDDEIKITNMKIKRSEIYNADVNNHRICDDVCAMF